MKQIRAIKSIQKVVLFVVPLVLYANTLHNSFALDDTMMITGNEYTKAGVEGLRKIFTHDAFAGFLGENKNLLPGGRYRPLSQALFNGYYSLLGENARGLHLINILLFAFSVLILFKVLRELIDNGEKWWSIPFIVSLMYAVHPLHTEVVANIKSLDLILTAIFSLLSFHYAIKYGQKHHWRQLLLLVLMMFLALLSKEKAITFVVLIPLSLWWFNKAKNKETMVLSLALLLGAGLYFVLRLTVVGWNTSVQVNELLNNPFLHAGPGERMATVFYTWLVYLKLFIFPHPLTHDYYPFVIAISSFKSPVVWFSVLLFGTMSFFSFRAIILKIRDKEYKPPLHYYGFIFFMLVFSITSNLIINIGTLMNERFVFVADVGLMLMTAWGIKRLETYLNGKLLYALLLTVLLAFSLKTITRNRVWKDDYTLFTTDAKVSYNSAKCNVSAGGKTMEKAEAAHNPEMKKRLLLQAEKYIRRGLKIHPKYFQGWMLLAQVYYDMNKWNQALLCYENCLAIGGGNADALNNLRNLAIMSAREGEITVSDKALQHLKHYNYMLPNVYYLQAVNRVKQHQIDSALVLLSKVLKIDSTYDDAYNKLGEIYGRFFHEPKVSEHYLLKAYTINPKNSSVLENLGVVYGLLNELDKSLYFFKEAIRVNPDNAQVYNNIAITYHKLNKPEQEKKYRVLGEKYQKKHP